MLYKASQAGCCVKRFTALRQELIDRRIDKQRGERRRLVDVRSGSVDPRHRPGILQANALATGLCARVKPGKDRRTTDGRLLRDIVDAESDACECMSKVWGRSYHDVWSMRSYVR